MHDAALLGLLPVDAGDRDVVCGRGPEQILGLIIAVEWEIDLGTAVDQPRPALLRIESKHAGKISIFVGARQVLGFTGVTAGLARAHAKRVGRDRPASATGEREDADANAESHAIRIAQVERSVSLPGPEPEARRSR